MDLSLHAIAYGFWVTLQPLNLFACFVGVFIGTLIGVLPGIGLPIIAPRLRAAVATLARSEEA